MASRLFVFGGFDPLAAGWAGVRARAFWRATVAGRQPRLAIVTSVAEAAATASEWRERAGRSGLALEALCLGDSGDAARLTEFDLLHFPAGHTAHLLHHLGPHAARLRAAWQAGLVLSGTSGGGACFGAQVWSASRFGEAEWIAGLGFVPLALCVHFDRSAWAKPRLPAPGDAGDTLALDDDALLDWSPRRAEIVALRPGARGHRLRPGTAPEPLVARDLNPLAVGLIRIWRAWPGRSRGGL